MRDFFRKNRKVITWSVVGLAVLIILFFVYLRISATLHFSLQTELITTHDPSQVVVSTTNGENVDITIKTHVNTFHACDSACDYYVDGVYSLKNQSEKDITHKFTISTPNSGFGQELFYFKSSCTTIASTFCPSSSKKINQTSLIIVDYFLKKEEEKFVSGIEETKSIISNATQLVSKIRYSKLLLTLWPMQGLKVLDDKNLAQLITAFSSSWRAQNYLQAKQILFDIDDSIVEETASDILLNNLKDFNSLQIKITDFLSNETVREFVEYSQNYSSQAGTVRQAVNRLNVILAQKYIEDLQRNQVIANGAIDYLQSSTNNYSTQKNIAITNIERARVVLPLIKTSLTSLPIEMCDAISALKVHNSWADNSNFTKLSDATIKTIIQSTNATYVFNLPEKFCERNNQSIQIELDYPIKNNIIKVPAQIMLSPPNLSNPVAQCRLGFNDVECDLKKSPLLFIHGHSFDESNSPQISMSSFSQLQERMENIGYVNAGELTQSTNGSIMSQFTMRASYYYIKQYGIGDYSFEIQKSERIENYALRLKEIIDNVKEISGADNVTIIAHSMGGLVVREYANLFGMNSVNRVITINSPHQGIAGRTAKICDLIGAAKECEDMTANSTFLKRLPPISGEWDVIASTGCDMGDGQGDGVVYVQNSVLPGATYHLLNGTCTDALKSDLHTVILDDPRLYDLISKLLRS